MSGRGIAADGKLAWHRSTYLGQRLLRSWPGTSGPVRAGHRPKRPPAIRPPLSGKTSGQVPQRHGPERHQSRVQSRWPAEGFPAGRGGNARYPFGTIATRTRAGSKHGLPHGPNPLAHRHLHGRTGMTTPTNLTHDLEWPSGSSCPTGIALQAASKSINDLSRFLALFLLEGAHTTLRGSNPEGVREPRNSGILGASPVLKCRRKALFAANTARADKYNRNRSMLCQIVAARPSLARER